MLEGPLPDVPIGEHCTRPYDCPFIERCWPKVPDHHVSKLYRIERKRALELEADGYATIYDLPSDLELSVIHARQVKAVQTGRMVVERTLPKALAQFASPLAFLDFETVSLAIPGWPGCRPWQQVPVQFSVHVEERGRGLVHHQWIAEGPEDPRPALAEALVEACVGARKVVAYHATFERECIKQLREAVPRFAGNRAPRRFSIPSSSLAKRGPPSPSRLMHSRSEVAWSAPALRAPTPASTTPPAHARRRALRP